ncbi:hypothetical protein [Limnohabitans sp. 2KL-27]|uniref:hypothetical protein n=1 Tax=Limnohabitans sp. 2KL-27 TaxID=1100705 RepID=UPI000A6A9F13|nr:hypothetical protein [Limnohabitans sp. 2KL-27]
MFSSLVRNLITAIALAGLAWAAQGQNNVLEDPKKEKIDSFGVFSADSSDPALFRDLLSQSLGELIRYESAVLSELRKGFERLNKSCLRSTPPKSPPDNALLSRNILAFEQAAAVVASRQDTLSRTATAFELAAKRQEVQHCSGLSSNLTFGFLKSPSCKQAQNLQSLVKTYRSGLEQYYQLQSERYRTYLELAQIEQQSCVRAGFTGRLLQANEVHMRESEAQSQRLLVQWDRDLARLLQAGGTPP